MIQQLLKEGASVNLKDETSKQKYFMSVTENEIVNGLLEANDMQDRCLWFKRNIVGLENADDTDHSLKKFYGM